MNTKKLIAFLLLAFLPMAIVGLVMHLSGASAANHGCFPVSVRQVYQQGEDIYYRFVNWKIFHIFASLRQYRNEIYNSITYHSTADNCIYNLLPEQQRHEINFYWRLD